MPMIENRIGPFTFISLSHPPQQVVDQIVTHNRAGVDGTMLANLGTWGEPFEVHSLAAAVTYGRAWELAGEYHLLVGGAAVDVVWSDFPLLLGRHVYFALHVRVTAVQRVLRGVSPVGPYGAEIEATWRLAPMRLRPEDLPQT